MTMPPEHPLQNENIIPKYDMDLSKIASNLSPLAASLAGGVPGLIGGGLSALSQFVTNEKNKKFQIEMWNKVNEYNSPKSQMKRFRDAGLNPSLIYGQMSNASSPNITPMQPLNFDFLGQTAQNAIANYNTREINEVSKANGLVDYFTGSEMLDWLPVEKQELFKKLRYEVSKSFYDADISRLQRDLDQLNYDYDFTMRSLGFPPNISPKEQIYLGTIASVFDYLGIMKPEQFIQFLFGTQQN